MGIKGRVYRQRLTVGLRRVRQDAEVVGADRLVKLETASGRGLGDGVGGEGGAAASAVGVPSDNDDAGGGLTCLGAGHGFDACQGEEGDDAGGELHGGLKFW